MCGDVSVCWCPCKGPSPHRPLGTWTSETMETALVSAEVQWEDVGLSHSPEPLHRKGRCSRCYKSLLTKDHGGEGLTRQSPDSIQGLSVRNLGLEEELEAKKF